MSLRKSEWFLLALVAVSFALGAWAYPQLPPIIASHWDAAGNVNGFMPRFWGVFLFPIVFLIVAVLFFIIPHIDPRKDNIARFRKYFDYFIIGLGVIMLYIYCLTLAWNMGYLFDLGLAIMPPLAAIVYLAGALMSHTEQNFMIGIRTPWTISSATVWKKTNGAGGIILRICAVIALVGIAFPPFEIWFFIVPLFAAAIGLVIYSYVLYRGEAKR